MNFYSIGDVAEKIGVSVQTLRNWDNSGRFKSHHKSPGGTRYYTEEQVSAFLGLSENGGIIKNKIVVGYCRVSSSKQKDDLNRQVENVKTYMIANGYQFEIITDIGSGINYNKKGLNKLLKLIVNKEVDRIVVLYKDRLLRFGFELIENLCKLHDIQIDVIDNTEKTEEQELIEDLIQIVTVFSCKLQGKRAHKTRKMIEELVNNE